MSPAESSGFTEKRSFCRICSGICGTVVTVDKNERIVAVRGDNDDPQTMGFICSKGTGAADAHYSPERILHPLKRMPNGKFERISLEQALQEIADKLKQILERDGPEAIAAYRGSGAFFTAICLSLLPDWMRALGTPKLFSTLTIDQSAKLVAVGRLGIWPPGQQRFNTSDVQLLFGANPLVSISHLDSRNPLKRLKEAKARGMKLIVVDPRRTETAKFADIFIQPLPGTDALIAGALLRIIIDEGWHDREFCEQHVSDLAELRAAVEPLTEEFVERAADIAPGLLRQAAEAFAHNGTRGVADTGTGPDMSPFSNLNAHMVQCLNVVCGRYIREGEEVNSGFLVGRGPRPAQVVPAPRWWEHGPKSRIGGYGLIGGEMVTGVLADEILQPGPGQVKFLLNHGGNPALAVPDQQKMVKALRSLEMLVSIEPYMTPSAALSDYILPPKLPYERADLPIYIFESIIYPTPYTRYTPKMVEPPVDAEVCDEWYVLWSLAQRLGKQLQHMGVDLDMRTPPTEDYLLSLTAKDAPVPFDEIKRHELGCFYEDEKQVALPADPATAGKFSTLPDDVRAELKDLLKTTAANAAENFAFRLVGRRARHRFNSFGFTAQPALKRLLPLNYAYMNPDDMAARSIVEGGWIKIESDNGSITVIAQPDETVRNGVVSISHGFGGLPDEDNYLVDGASPNLLISTNRDLQSINAMPRMSGVPVNIHAVFEPPIRDRIVQ